MEHDRTSSATAAGVALLRVLHQKIDAEPRILEDEIAERLLDPRAVRWALDHRGRFETAEARGLRAHVVVRSRYSEDAMAAAVRGGVRQVVWLGAGFETFPYRQPDWARTVRLFEVDHPASQEEKRRRVAAAGLAIPENLTFAPVDFERESTGDGLMRAGCDGARATFFSCLGVLMYLTTEAADDLFGLVGRFPGGSELVLTFSQDGSRSEAQRRLEERVAAVGEPLKSRYSLGTLESKLVDAGMGAVDFVSPETLAERYFHGDRRDGLKPPRHTTLAHARI